MGNIREKVKRSFILLPAYNEEKALPLLLESVQKTSGMGDFCVVVVNDGSTDKTARILNEYRTKIRMILLEHKANRGLGEALKTGLMHINQIAGENDIVISMDADNSHDPGLASRLIDAIREGYDISIASRYCRGGKQIGLSLGRRILSRGVNWLLGLLFPIKGVRDYTSGFRAYRLSIIRRGFRIFGDRFIREKRFTSVTEILVKLAALGAKISESPLILRYDLKRGKSKVRFPNVFFEYLYLFFSLKQHMKQSHR